MELWPQAMRITALIEEGLHGIDEARQNIEHVRASLQAALDDPGGTEPFTEKRRAALIDDVDAFIARLEAAFRLLEERADRTEGTMRPRIQRGAIGTGDRRRQPCQAVGESGATRIPDLAKPSTWGSCPPLAVQPERRHLANLMSQMAQNSLSLRSNW